MEPPDSLQQVVGEVWLDAQGPADSTALGSHGQRRPGEAGLQRRRGCDLQVSVGSLRQLPAHPGEPASARDCVSPTEPQLNLRSSALGLGPPGTKRTESGADTPGQ